MAETYTIRQDKYKKGGTSSHCSLSPATLSAWQFPSANFIGRVYFIYSHPSPYKDFIFIKISLDVHCILLYNLARFYENLYFKKRIAFMEEKEIMTVKQVAEYLQMDEHTVYKLARSGQIPSLKIAGQWLHLVSVLLYQ
ncbi:MAG: helix-turn-helix domain-containing protein [Ignavibacterium sp.]|nr:helix-turn-helix domain-containing protein [Ignavibacterium sp.]